MEFWEIFEEKEEKEENKEKEKLQINYNELFEKYVNMKKENYSLKCQIKSLKYFEDQCFRKDERIKELEKTKYIFILNNKKQYLNNHRCMYEF
jgi:hypothetical protein